MFLLCDGKKKDSLQAGRWEARHCPPFRIVPLAEILAPANIASENAQIGNRAFQVRARCSDGISDTIKATNDSGAGLRVKPESAYFSRAALRERDIHPRVDDFAQDSDECG